MKRDITKKLLAWKESQERMPLLLTGVRQCGKTYIMKDLGETAFNGDYAYFNFEKNSALAEIFSYDLDPSRIVKELGLVHGKAIVPGKTLLIFDEIQSCIPAITSLKYFCEEMPDLHVIGAGSLLGVTLNAVSLSFPVGKVDRLQMYPLSFKEFLEAQNPKTLDWFESRYVCGEPISDAISAPLATALKLYYIIGGMPKAVETWLRTSDLEQVEHIQDNILKDYQDDFTKHAPKNDVPKLHLIWDSIPEQLAKENNKFVFSHVKQGKRAAELEDALKWLEDAGLAYKLKLVNDIGMPLSHRASSTNFKLYMGDVGLLRRKAGVSAKTIMQGGEDYVEFKGALTENYVMQQLLALDKKPYFWRSNNQAELDFLFEEAGNAIPVEVKSENNTKAKSYAVFCKKYNPKFGFITSLRNVGDHEVGVTHTYSLPLYLLWKMDDWISKETSASSDFNLADYISALTDLDNQMK
jgi:predicted AAA+ superfamily ATPase